MTLSGFKDKYLGKQVEYHSYGGSDTWYQLCMKILSFSLFPSFNSILDRFMSTEKYLLVINLNVRPPFVGLFIKIDTNSSASVITPGGRISQVGGISANPQIRASVIKRVPVYVVNILSFFGLHNPAMKLYQLTTKKSFLKINESLSFFNHTPLHCFQRFQSNVINIINECGVGSMLLAIECNFSHMNSLSEDDYERKYEFIGIC